MMSVAQIGREDIGKYASLHPYTQAATSSGFWTRTASNDLDSLNHPVI